MHVSELLERKGSEVIRCPPDSPISAVVATLHDHRIGAVVVTGAGGEVEGIVSERDVIAALAQFGAGALSLPVRTVMTSEVETCAVDDTVDELMAVMTNRRIRHVPVLQHGRLAGIVSIGDVVKSRLDELEADRDALVNYIGAR